MDRVIIILLSHSFACLTHHLIPSLPPGPSLASCMYCTPSSIRDRLWETTQNTTRSPKVCTHNDQLCRSVALYHLLRRQRYILPPKSLRARDRLRLTATLDCRNLSNHIPRVTLMMCSGRSLFFDSPGINHSTVGLETVDGCFPPAVFFL